MITKQKGTYDVYGKKGRDVLALRNIFEDLMTNYNYEYFRTPVFESSSLFHRGVGETTDIVSKETYDFKDRGDRDLTLRPESTAAIVRSYIENKLYTDPNSPKKCWFFEPMYRYERPQSGRMREHFQFGVEVFGSDDPLMDAEVISIPVNFYRLLGLKGVTVHINSLGDKKTRDDYRSALVEYLTPHINELCPDCQNRFLKNPLRIIDCKFDKDSKILKNVPSILDYQSKEAKKHFNLVLKYLDALEIPYEIDPKIVRGLDYYTNTVFEVIADIKEFGAQNVMCAGGRYNNLVKTLDGPDVPAVGFGMGIERLMMALDYENIDVSGDNSINCYIAPIGDEAKDFSLALCNTLRILGLKSDMDYLNRTLKSNFKQAERLGAKFMIIVGDEEIDTGVLTVRNMQTKTEEKVDNAMIIDYLVSELESLEDDCCDDGCSCDDCSCDDHCSGECHCKD